MHTGPSPRRLLLSVSFAHFTNDVFMSSRSVLLAFMAAYMLPMSNLQIGLALTLGELVGAFSQPFFGLLADRTGGRWLGAVGVAWTVTGIMIALLVALAGGGYGLMLIPLSLAALGSGAVHPVGSLHAAGAEPLRAARNTSVFFLFGQIGLGLGPALTGLLLDRAHTSFNTLFAPALGPAFSSVFFERGTVAPVLILWGLAVPAALLLARTVPVRLHTPAAPVAAINGRDTAKRLNVPVWPFVVLGAAVLLRSLANPATISFIPRMFQAKGWSPAEYGLLTSTFWVSSGAALMIYGQLAARFDIRRLITLGMALSAPAIFLLPLLDGGLAFVLAVAIGGLSGGTHSLIVVLAQGLLPGRKGFASGLILGFIFATGAIGNLIIGHLSDRIGTAAAFQVVAVVTVAACGLWLLLPRPGQRPAPRPETAAAPEAVRPG
jgi:FSR family fosmidomycin resistance protein-like MFS transporter